MSMAIFESQGLLGRKNRSRSHGHWWPALLIWLSCGFVARCRGQCDPADREALVSFKSAITEDGSQILSSWSDGNCCGGWEGVGCDPATGRVVRLELQNRAAWNETVVMRGTLSPALGNLSYLEVIVINGFREITGGIPSSIGSLPRLRQLYLENNKLSGSIPTSLGKLSRLETLSLNGNRLRGGIPASLGGLRSLIQLNLAKNRLAGAIPPALQKLRGLQFLDFNENALSGAIPDFVGGFENATFLDFSKNALTGGIPASLGNLSKVLQISLGSNKLTGRIPETLGRLQSLSSLSLGNNLLEGMIPEALCNASKLWYLNLSRNHLSDPLPAGLGNLSDLLSLDLSYNNFRLDRIPECITGKEMTDVHLAGCGIAGRLSDWKPRAVSMFTSIDLSDNRLTGEIGGFFANMSRLEKIFLSNNLLRSDLSDARFPELIGTLDLRGNRLYGLVRGIFYNITGACSSTGGCLDYLDLSDNEVSGSIPELDGDRKLKWMDLSGNSLSGRVPSSISTLKEMERLDLSRNRLDGRIPPGIGALEELRWLDLSGNALSGAIPAEILRLRKLKHINLRFNHLCGKIPQGKPLNAFPASAFAHNDCLCGSPLPSCRGK